MIYILEKKDVRKVENFNIKNNLVIPFISINFSDNGHLPLKSITINPENKDFRACLKNCVNGYNIPVNISKSKTR